MNEHPQGRFITLEGGDGAGKTTQARALQEQLRAAGHSVVFTREPGGVALGEVVQDLLHRPAILKYVYNSLIGSEGWSNVIPLAELFLFAAVRAQHVKDVIRPALERDDIVVCDRYTDSTLAYQGYGHGLNLNHVRVVNHIAAQGLTPDLTILLDVPVEVGMTRHVAARGDHFARQDRNFHERVRQGYLVLAQEEPERWLVVDGTLPTSQVTERIWERLERLL